MRQIWASAATEAVELQRDEAPRERCLDRLGLSAFAATVLAATVWMSVHQED
jgi:hypothetical protein